ncbi:patatin-like phospholipase family protein [Microbispora sp. GKU 823]|uniref:patatin-like phospholipase family protein n=1 Tax=Microbispora sp. GKU 823 TaxID=1652100 RepID=UPI0009A3121F|nr:patatin-like phospholipase family protein [Microbispora sp. GKU 823]OPG07337.1 hypothetical protein B1L11_30840 [Microbispora sp. GKU 823]
MTTAFILWEGGSLGAAQVGMLRALTAHGIGADMVVGASIGALDGAYYAARPDAAGVEEPARLWLSVSSHDVYPVSGPDVLRTLAGNLPFHPLPGTVVVDRPHLDPNPFDAEPADPIVLVPAHLTTLTPQAIRRLRRRVAEPSQGTVRWRTWGLDAEVARVRECQELRRWPAWEPPVDARGAAAERTGGALVFRAPPSRLRLWGVDVAMLGEWSPRAWTTCTSTRSASGRPAGATARCRSSVTTTARCRRPGPPAGRSSPVSRPPRIPTT